MNKLLVLLIVLFLVGVLNEICILNGNATNEDVKVWLGFERTTVKEGSEVRITLSAINPITNPTLIIQLILTVPDDMSITATEFVKSGGRQFTSTYFIEPGDNERQINIHVKTHRSGVYPIIAEYYYYFEGINSTSRYGNITKDIYVLPNHTTPSPTTSQTPTPSPPAFEVTFAIAALLAVAYFAKRKK